MKTGILKMMNRTLLLVGMSLVALATAIVSEAAAAPQYQRVLTADRVTVTVAEDLCLSVYQGGDDPVWLTLAKPGVEVKPAGTGEARMIRLADAADRSVESFDDGTHKGHRFRFRGLADTDVEMELILALATDGELLVQVAKLGGEDSIRRVASRYDFRVAPAPNAYAVVPVGSGYLIRSDSPDAVSLAGFLGGAYSLPIFGFVRGDKALYQIVETWWDAHLSIEHIPGDGTTMRLDWKSSNGRLSYARRVLLRFAENMDHAGMAKGYRRYLTDRNELTTLEQRVAELPVLGKFLASVEYRATNPDPERPELVDEILDAIDRFNKAGLPVVYFYPKFMGLGHAPGRTPDAAPQGFLQAEPLAGGWPMARKLATEAHKRGCVIKMMINPKVYLKDAPAYDPAKATGVRFPAISDHHALWLLKLVLDNMEAQNLPFEALYFDTWSAQRPHPEHTSEAGGPVSRRQTFETQIACFRETRRRGIIPGAELARFWSVPECDFFFFTDWSKDRLRNGEPVPLFQLVFHDCYAAHFSGGGYYRAPKYDWYADRHPRLYELMYVAMPSHNWLPYRRHHLRPKDWESDAMARHLRWLKRWHAYYQKVCYSQMLDHRFLNGNRSLQRVEFANGVTADFDLDKGLFRVKGVSGFTGDWERPEDLTQ